MRQKSWHAKILTTKDRTGGHALMNRKDRLYEKEISETGDFVFDDRVVRVFPDMINRSVPGYSLVVPMIGMLARQYAQPGTNLYDLGCSLGAASLAMRDTVQAGDIRIWAVDNSEEMIQQFRTTLQTNKRDGLPGIELLHQDVLDTPIENASVVVLNFTLQFVAPQKRFGLIKRIRQGLNNGGILVLSEKIRFEDPVEQELQTRWHHEFKRSQGYSELEIARKRDALENVMKPDSMQQHRDRLHEAGFRHVCQWFQGFNFISLVAFG
jgi:tRNA (cmo5U34)-methyltransferase